jgi:hypothetical protein
MEEVAHSLAREILVVRLRELVVGTRFYVRSLVVVGSVVVLVVEFVVVVVAVVGVLGSVAGLGEVWVVVGEEGRIRLEVECLVVEEVGSSCGWSELEEAMMEGERSVVVAGACHFQRQEEEGNSSTL